MLPLLAAAAATTPTAEPPCKSPRTFRASVEAGLYGVPTHSRGEAGAGELFACGEQLILMSSVNDEYCDCADGSDEPRTGACPNQPFACTLPRQSQPVTVFASRVNDGVCDCCDGSDEWRSAVSCANQCTARHVPGGWAWLVIAVAALLSLLLGSMCLLVLATPSHGVGAPSLLLLLLGAEACVLLARRRHAAHGELAAMLAHAAALPALCLLPDATASEHYAALGLAYANFLLRLIPHLRPSGAPDASMVARLGLRCLALLPIVLRGAMMWWAHPSFYRGGTGTAALRSPDEL